MQDEYTKAWNADQTSTGVDPNTGQPLAPVSTVGAAAAKDQATYVDEWSKAPADVAPVRTWVDAGARDANNADPTAQYEAAWHDTPAASTPLQNATAASAPAVAAAPAAPADAGDYEFRPASSAGFGNDPGQPAAVYDRKTNQPVADADPAMVAQFAQRFAASDPNGLKASMSSQGQPISISSSDFRLPPAAPAPGTAPTAVASPSPAPAPAPVPAGLMPGAQPDPSNQSGAGSFFGSNPTITGTSTAGQPNLATSSAQGLF